MKLKHIMSAVTAPTRIAKGLAAGMGLPALNQQMWAVLAGSPTSQMAQQGGAAVTAC